MAGEEDVVDAASEAQLNETEAQQQQSLLAFNQAVDGNEARVEESAPAENPKQENATEPKVVASVEAQAETPPEEKVGVTAEQLTAMLAKLPKIEEEGTMTAAEIRKLHGKIGEINRGLQELQKGGSKAAVKLTGAKFKRLHADYPDLADLLAEDLNETEAAEATQTTEATTQPNENFDERVAKVKEDLTKEMQTNLLLVQHRDFLNVIQSNDFKVWAQTLPKPDQAQLENSWDAIYLGEKLTEFKDWYGNKQTGTQERKERLERAITPKGAQATTKHELVSAQQAFEAAFNKR